MEMKFRLEYEVSVVREDIPRLSHPVKIKIKNAIEQKLTAKPEVFGKPLRKSLKGYRSLRVGDYRVIFRISADDDASGGAVKIFAIMHRSVAYKAKRLN